MTIWNPDITTQERPIYLAIVNSLAQDIKNSRLKPGYRLPTHRDLADSLGVTVGTVTRAYAEAHRRGLIKAEVGRGTYVAEQSFDMTHLSVDTHLSDAIIDLSLNTPVYEHDPDLAASLKQLASRPDLGDLLRYLPSSGLPRHRAAGAAWLKKCRLSAKADEVVICGGSQHAIQVSLGAVVRPGDAVLTESLLYPGVKALAAMFGLRLESTAMDDEGLVPEACEAALKKGGIKAMYCNPTLHNPTTGTLSESRRRKLAELARKYDLLIIEDDLNGLFVPDAPPPLSSFAPERSCYLAGTSKALAGGLRISYLVGPPMLYQRLKHNVTSTIWMATPLTAELAANWIEDGTVNRIVRRRREESAERHNIACRVLAGLSFRSHPAAYNIWLHLPDPWRSGIFAAETLKHGVAVTPAEAFTVGPGEIPNAVRVSLSAARTHQQLERGLSIIAQILSGPQALTPGIF